jgi:hypothetical protein
MRGERELLAILRSQLGDRVLQDIEPRDIRDRGGCICPLSAERGEIDRYERK